MGKTLLVTGFEPFNGQSLNPSLECAFSLPSHISGVEIIKEKLPVLWGETETVICELLKKYRPNAVLAIGQAGNSEMIRVERIAVNLRESSTPDNAGVIINGVPVIKNAANAYFSTFPYTDILSALKSADIPCEYSFSAGTYLCNAVLYCALHNISSASIGFIHLPFIPEQIDVLNTMELPKEKQAILIAASVICEKI
ncbi:MAG: pyroglutamyl-peptidase I [Clostridia bacterium]